MPSTLPTEGHRDFKPAKYITATEGQRWLEQTKLWLNGRAISNRSVMADERTCV
jgi:hypothetical protein